jgi:hypothetical protein
VYIISEKKRRCGALNATWNNSSRFAANRNGRESFRGAIRRVTFRTFGGVTDLQELVFCRDVEGTIPREKRILR